MPRRVQPYGSAVDAESAGLAHGRPGSVPGGGYELGSTLTAREVAQQAAEAVAELNELTAAGADAAGLDDVRDVVDSLRRMIAGLPRLCEQLARIIVVQREDRQAGADPGQDPDFWVAEAVEALAAAGQAADMLTAALAEAGTTSAELRSRSAGR
jgi:hypothetical protein